MKLNKTSIIYKFIFLLMISVIPLNILSIGCAYIMLRDIYVSVNSSIHSVLASYANKLDEQIYNSNFLLYDTLQNNENALAMYHADSDTSYKISRQKLFVEMIDSLSISNTADIMFFNIDERNELFLIPKNNSPIAIDEASIVLNEYLQHNNGKWNLIMVAGSPCAIQCNDIAGYQCGAIIDINSILSDINKYWEYKDYSLTISNKPIEKAKNSVLISEKCNNIDLYFHLSINQAEILKGISMWKWGIVLLLLVYIALIPFLYRYLHRWVIFPLAQLNNAHAELKAGHQQYRIAQQASSYEFNQAYLSFNEMADSIQHLTLETINKELAYKQMLLTNLQLQIRPHFLLNTFSLLYTLIKTHNITASQKIILYLSEYFRCLFQHNEELELFDKEYNLILKYLEIVDIRFPGAFTFTSQIDPEISLIRLPILLLHNFIENIINHALIPERIIHIMFYAAYDDGMVTFQIADDGRGMPQEDVDQINYGEYEGIKKGKHVGLRNSITRLKYFYEEKASVTVESKLNEGTTFTIIFPYDLEIDAEK